MREETTVHNEKNVLSDVDEQAQEFACKLLRELAKLTADQLGVCATGLHGNVYAPTKKNPEWKMGFALPGTLFDGKLMPATFEDFRILTLFVRKDAMMAALDAASSKESDG